MPVKSDREYRRIDVANLEARTEDDDKRIIEGYATTFNQEYTLWETGDYKVVEAIDRHAFDNTEMDDTILQFDHQGRVFARTKNGTLKLSADDHGLKVSADLGGTENGRQLYDEIKGGYIDKMSFGFTVAKDQRTEERDEANNKTVIHRLITSIKRLFDVSVVSIPANDATEVSARSCGDGLIEAARVEYAARLERKRKIQKIKILMEVDRNDD